MADINGIIDIWVLLMKNGGFMGDLNRKMYDRTTIITLLLFNIAMGHGPCIEVYRFTYLKTVIFHGYGKWPDGNHPIISYI